MKIISGGQTGVDRGALEAAIELGIQIGGWCPPGRRAEDGVIPSTFTLWETPVERSDTAPHIPRSLRTEWNVHDADAILILNPYKNHQSDPGTSHTISVATKLEKPFLICNPFNSDSIKQIREWLKIFRPQSLNIAGPSEGSIPGISKVTRKLIVQILDNNIEVQNNTTVTF